MLAPDDRHLFLHALRPPIGYVFDCSIGTTFTLDLFTLLVTPLSLALFDYDNQDIVLQDPLALLESLRRYADQLTIFCQSGRISSPTKATPLLNYLEEMVVEVQAPKGGVFHPKLWLLRYTAEDKPVFYRLLNLSRNLTFDKSWDIMLCLEGEVAKRRKGLDHNQPLGDFLAALPGLALHRPKRAVSKRLALFQDEVSRVDFRPPEYFDGDIDFFPSGIPGYRGYPFKESMGRTLVVSPFLTKSFLDGLNLQSNDNTLISSSDSLDELPDNTRNRFKQIFTLNELAEPESQDTSSIDEDLTKSNIELSNAELSGLHAKLFIWESGWDANWLVGSANATNAAFLSNVEFMVKLTGKKSRVGVEAVLGDPNEENTFFRLLREYTPPDKKIPIDNDKKQAESLADEVRKWLIDSCIQLEVRYSGEDKYTMLMKATKLLKPPEGNIDLFCWPISVQESRQHNVPLEKLTRFTRFEGLSLVNLTAFMAFKVVVKIRKTKFITRFVFNLPLKGMPPERDSAVLSQMLSNSTQFLRYLRLLLMEDKDRVSSDGWALSFSEHANQKLHWEDLDMPLLEDLIRALSRSNQSGGKIERINDLVQRLKRTQEGQDIIPPEFDSLWQIIMQASRELS